MMGLPGRERNVTIGPIVSRLDTIPNVTDRQTDIFFGRGREYCVENDQNEVIIIIIKFLLRLLSLQEKLTAGA